MANEDNEMCNLCLLGMADRDPRMLPCAHSFCLGCLEAFPLIKNCFVCRQSFVPPLANVRDLPKNFWIARFAELKRKSDAELARLSEEVAALRIRKERDTAAHIGHHRALVSMTQAAGLKPCCNEQWCPAVDHSAAIATIRALHARSIPPVSELLRLTPALTATSPTLSTTTTPTTPKNAAAAAAASAVAVRTSVSAAAGAAAGGGDGGGDGVRDESTGAGGSDRGSSRASASALVRASDNILPLDFPFLDDDFFLNFGEIEDVEGALSSSSSSPPLPIHAHARPPTPPQDHTRLLYRDIFQTLTQQRHEDRMATINSLFEMEDSLSSGTLSCAQFVNVVVLGHDISQGEAEMYFPLFASNGQMTLEQFSEAIINLIG